MNPKVDWYFNKALKRPADRKINSQVFVEKGDLYLMD